MTELVQNMMSLAQMDIQATVKHEPVEMSALLTEMTEEFTPQAQAKEQTLLFTPLAEASYVNGKSFQLRQLFRNLIGNAIKYTPKGGTLNIFAKLNQGNFEVHVQDTGYGIPANDLPFIFDRFYRAHSENTNEIEGNGLGLAIVKSIVEQHDGQINVQSEINKGTRFCRISFRI